MIKILMPQLGPDGCYWYRLKQFKKCANELKLAEAREITSTIPEEELVKMVEETDVFIFRFADSTAKMVKTIKENHPDKVIVLDTDDDLYNVSPYNDSYGEWGLEEITLKDGAKLWQDGKFGFDVWRNRRRVLDYSYCMEKADVVTTTTPELARKIPHAVVIPNAINFDIFPVLNQVKDDKIRLLWHGGSSHYEDLYSVNEDIRKLMENYPNLHLYLLGSSFPGLVNKLPKDRVHTDGWVNADAHGYRLASINADIAICPLIPNEFNSNKSSVKYYENSALKIPTVAADTLPYNADIKDGENGLLYTDNFYSKVEKLIKNKHLRETLGNNAYEYVKKNRELESVTREWVSMLENLVQIKSGYITKPDAKEIEKISIVFPAHNRLNLVKQTLESLTKNTPREKYELVVVDDDSTDGTRVYLREQKSAGNIDKLIESANHSCGTSKNQGIKEASCEYIYISDSDMYFQEGWLEELLSVYHKLPASILGSCGHPWWPTLRKMTIDGREIHIVEQQPGNSWLISKDIWYKCGPLLEGAKYGEDDTEFCNRAHKQGIFVSHLNSSKVLHCGVKRSDGSFSYGYQDQIKNYPKGVITE